MQFSDSPSSRPGPWISLWVVALLSLLIQLWLCQFFSFGINVPVSIDIDPSNLWKFGYHFPPTGSFLVLNWLGSPNLPPPLNPFTLAANLPVWWFFTTYAPVMGTLALLAMAAFLRELELSRAAALFGAVTYAWQGDLLPFVFPGHYGYITMWPFFALAAWSVLRGVRTNRWAYALISGACCGLMVGLQPDRGAIASLLIAALYLAPTLKPGTDWLPNLRYLALCAGTALLIAAAPLFSQLQTSVIGFKMGGTDDRETTYKFVTQFCMAPQETLTYLAPGFFGWHTSNPNGLYWGWIGQTLDWSKTHQGTPDLNLGISTTGTVATVLALVGVFLFLPGQLLGPSTVSTRQRLYGQALLFLGFVALVLSWGWHTPFYRILFELPLMDKWRNPLKWLEITNFALVTLGAFGIQHLMDSLATDAKVVRQRLFWFTMAVLTLLALGLLASYPFTIVLRQVLISEGYDYNPDLIVKIIDTAHFSLFVALALMALASFILFTLWRPEKLRGFRLVNPLLDQAWHRALSPAYLPLTLSLGLTALNVDQLGWVATQFVVPGNLAMLTQSNPLLEELRAENDASSVRVSVDPQDPLLNTLLQNQFIGQHISCLEISAASRTPEDLDAFFGTLGSNRGRLWLLSGVKNVVVPEPEFPQLQHDPTVGPGIDHADGYVLQPTQSADLPSHALVTMRDYLAKATFVPKAEIIPEDKTLLKRLADPAWNPRESILLAEEPMESRLPGQASPDTHDQVHLQTYTPTEIDIDVQSAKGGYVLINDQYTPDWQAQVNGIDVPLLRADFIMRAVAIPAGSSTLTLHYAAHYRLGSLSVSATWMNNFSDGIMVAAWVVAGLVLCRREETAPSLG